MTKGLNINLLPSEIQKKRKAEKGLFVLIIGVVVFVGILMALSFLFGLKVTREENALDQMKWQTSKIDKEIGKYSIFKERKESVGKHQESISKAIAKQLFWHRFLNELSMVVPKNVSISKLDLTTDQITITAAAWNHQDVAEFLVRMMDLDELKDVWIDGSKDSELEEANQLGESSSSSDSESTSGLVGVEFTLTAKLKNPGAK